MGYITADYYTNTYLGIPASSSAELLKYIERASDDVNRSCQWGIVIADLDAVELELVQKATAAQVEYYVKNGDVYNQTGSTSETIMSYSRTKKDSESKNQSLSGRATGYLEQTGLMSRRVYIIDQNNRCFDE